MAENKLLLAMRDYWSQLIFDLGGVYFYTRLTLGAACTGGALGPDHQWRRKMQWRTGVACSLPSELFGGRRVVT
jgi:hypothetical protein